MNQQILVRNEITRTSSATERVGPCPRPRQAERVKRGSVHVESIPCGSRGCVSCGPRLKGSHVGHFADRFTEAQAGLGEGYMLSGVTLTMDTPRRAVMRQMDELDAILHAVLIVLRKRSQRRGHPLMYMLAIDVGDDGALHLHGIFGGGVSPDEIVEVWTAKGGGIVSEARPITTKQHLGGYVRYSLKSQFGPGRLRLPGVQQIRCSEGLGYYSKRAKDTRRAFQQARHGDDPVSLTGEERERLAERHAEINADRDVRKARRLVSAKQVADHPSEDERKPRHSAYINWVTPTHGIRTERDLTTGRVISTKVMARTEGRSRFECDCGTYDEAAEVCEALHEAQAVEAATPPSTDTQGKPSADLMAG